MEAGPAPGAVDFRRKAHVARPRSVLLAAVALIAFAAPVCAQSASYTAAQAEAGARAFTASACAACHMPDLSGGEGPPLTGSAFTSNWGGNSVAALLAFVKENMPATGPGSLSDQTYVELVAYLLSMNDAPAGETPLAMDATGTMSFGK
jgi:mono/diheme cytochrome c family protein